MWITALADALLPAAQQFIDKVTASDKTAATAAAVSNDPNAPKEVKQAAANVAQAALKDKHAAETAAMQAQTGGAAPTGGNGIAIAAAVVIAMLAFGKRRR